MFNLKEKLHKLLVKFIVKLTSKDVLLRNKLIVNIAGEDVKVIMNITVSTDVLEFNKIEVPRLQESGHIVTGCKIVRVPRSNAFVLKP